MSIQLIVSRCSASGIHCWGVIPVDLTFLSELLAMRRTSMSILRLGYAMDKDVQPTFKT